MVVSFHIFHEDIILMTTLDFEIPVLKNHLGTILHFSKTYVHYPQYWDLKIYCFTDGLSSALLKLQFYTD